MTSVSLPELPKGHEFEEFISAFYQSSKLFIERNIIERGVEEVLELDTIATDYEQFPPSIQLIELKSGSWGFTDLFKLKGWIDYLNIPKASFIVQKERQNIEFYKEKASALGINLIVIPNIKVTGEVLSEFIPPECINETDIAVWRFAYWVERNLLRRLNHKKKSHRNIACYSALKAYYYDVSSGVFFTENIVDKLNKLYDAFRKYPHITAKCAHELAGDSFDKEYSSLPDGIFSETYYKCKYTDVQISTFIEHRARLSILKSAIDLKLYQRAGETSKTESYLELLGYKIPKFDFLPQSFIDGLNTISAHPYFHKYAVFWQYFIWLFGGFILVDYEEQEYQLLSEQTGIPVEEIPNALSAYDALFPNAGGWFLDLSPHSNIRVLKMFPVPFMGVGANYRRLKYTENGDFKELKLTGQHTLTDLIKWNNLTVEVLTSAN